MKQEKIILISDIILDFKDMFYELVEFVEIDVCEKLTCQVSDGKTFAVSGNAQHVVMKPFHSGESAFILAAGVGIVDENFFPVFFQESDD